MNTFYYIYAWYWYYLLLASVIHAICVSRALHRRLKTKQLVERWALGGAVMAIICILREGVADHHRATTTYSRPERAATEVDEWVSFVARWGSACYRTQLGYWLCLIVFKGVGYAATGAYVLFFVTAGPGGKDIRRRFDRDWRERRRL